MILTSPGRPRAAPGTVPVPRGPTLESTPKQNEFLDAIFSGRYNYLAFGGGIRGTKTWTVLMATIMLCRMFPGSRWAIVRRDLPTLRRNTIPSLNKIRYTVNNFVGELNQSTWTYTCSNGSEIIIFPESFEGDPDLDRWKGLEVNGFILEESNELVEKSFFKAIERAGSWIIPPTPENPSPIQPPILILLTFNPCANWPRRLFYEPYKAGTIRPPYFFLPATIMDNPYASEAYRESLKNLRDEDYKRFVKGEWEATDDPDQMIKSQWVWDARNVEPVYGDCRLGVDVGRFGNDPSGFCLIRGNSLEWLKLFSNLSVDRVATTATAFAGDPKHYVPADQMRIDGVGVGGGVVDLCRKAGFDVFDFVAGAKPIHRPGSFYRFYNLRTQAWWEVGQKLRLGLLSFPEDVPMELVADLTAPRYEITADRMIKMESKDDIKTRLGRSTNAGDAFVEAAFDIPPATLRPRRPASVSRMVLR